jgi:serine/threonine protein phosphatase PrpC
LVVYKRPEREKSPKQQARMKMHVTVSTHAGYTAKRPPVVDGAAYTEDYSARFYVGPKWVSCVFDGHGGHAVAAACARLVPDLAAECLRDTTEAGLALLFERLDAQVALMGRPGGGATCNVTVVDTSTWEMTVASLGDSPTLVYEPVAGTYRRVFQTVDQDCADEEEQRRLRALGLFVFEQKARGTSGVHGTGAFRCRTAAGTDMMTMSSLGDAEHDEPRGAVNKVPRVYSGRRINSGSLLLHCSDGCMEDIAPFSPSLIIPSAQTRVDAVAAHIQEAMCPACGLLASADVAHHITKRQIESIALERGRRTDGGDAVAHSEWVESNFDNQTVVAVYFGETCGCAPQ